MGEEDVGALLFCIHAKRIKAHRLCSLLSSSQPPGFQQLVLVAVRTMSHRGNGSGRGGARSARLELQLNLSPPAPPAAVEAADDSDSSSPSSCVSSDGGGRSSSGSPGGSRSPMVIGACTRCLMYCMVAKKDYPTCINCKQPCLVDLLHGEAGGEGAVVDADDKKRGKRK
ncbi:hypothetical protein EJB05_02347, partial [Eragrostis curvula]